MNGLILAGGEGSRLAEVGAPKPLVELGGRALVTRLAEQLAALGCSSITCMVRDEFAADVHASLGALEVPVDVVACRTPSSLHTLAEGFDRVPEGPVFCTLVDTVMADADWRRVYREVGLRLERGAEVVLAVTPFVDDESPVHVRARPDGRVLGIGDAPADPIRVTGGAYGFGPSARRAAREAVARGERRLRAFLRSALERGLRTDAVEVARIFDVDRPQDLVAAKLWWLDAMGFTR
jgi:molybdopterin-guanine dinucleotide biosynthesis protein A